MRAIRGIKFRNGNYPDSPLKRLLAGFYTGEGAKPNTTLHCAFCGRTVGQFEATFGSGPTKMRHEVDVKVVSTEAGIVEIPEDVVRFSQAKLVACPTHANLITPEVRYWCAFCQAHRYSKVCRECKHHCSVSEVKNKIKFPSLEDRTS